MSKTQESKGRAKTKATSSSNLDKSGAPKISALFNRELLIRTLSAIVLASIALYLTYLSPTSFIFLTSIIAVLMVWEWGRLTNNDTPIQLAIQAGTITVAITACLTSEWPLLISALIAGAFLSCWSTHYWWRSKWALLGLFYVGAPILSLIYLRSSQTLGFEAVLFVFLIVWGTDTAAYFTGRHFGGAKLAPSISPGKTRSGFYGGLFAGLIIGAIFAISMSIEPVMLSLIGLFLSAISQLGDLAESAIKRHFGVKDSGHLIPGHGGVLDRLDGIVTAAICAAIIAAIHSPANPASGLLIWFQ